MKQKVRCSMTFITAFMVLVSLCIVFPDLGNAQGEVMRLGGTEDPEDTLMYPEYIPGELIVKLKEGRTLADIKSLNKKYGVTVQKKAFKNKKDKKHIIDKLKESVIKAKANKKSREKIQRIEKRIARLERRLQRAPKNAVRPALLNIYVFKLDEGADVPAVARRYSTHPAVEYAEPNMITHPNSVPNDPHWNADPYGWGFNYLYGLENSQCEAAWDTTVGRPDVIIAPIESGIDIDHEDFGFEDSNQNRLLDAGEDRNGNGTLDAGNIWVNDLEFNGIPDFDDDGNGYVDDVYGAHFNDDVSYNTWIVESAHGTHVAGTIAAVGDNGIGVVGMTWNSKIMPALGLSILGKAQAIIYAADNGADVITNSWYSIGLSPTVQSAVDYAHSLGCVVVASAGNRNTETLTQAPAQLENLITVAAVDYMDVKADFSNFGVKIDVAAPGVVIGSMYPNDTYAGLSGTSMAAPHVAGLAALIISNNLDLNEIAPAMHPLLTSEEIRQIIRKSADDVPDPLGDGGYYPGFDMYTGYGRINAFNAMQYTSACEANIFYPTVNKVLENKNFLIQQGEEYFRDAWVAVAGTIDIKGIANCRDFQEFTIEYGQGLHPQSWTLEYSGTVPVTGASPDDILYTIDTNDMENGPNIIRLTVTDTFGETFEDRLMVDVARALVTNIPREDNPLFFEPTDIEGYAMGSGFLNYHLEYGVGASPLSWTTVTPNYYSETVDSILFDEFDFTQLPEGTLSLKLSVNDSIVGTSEDTLLIENDSTNFPLQQGFPIPYGDGIDLCIDRPEKCLEPEGYSSPVTADIDNDGQKEIIIAAWTHDINLATHSYLYVYGSDGTEMLNILLEPAVMWKSTYVYSSPVVGNLDDDPEMEIGIKYKNMSSGQEHIDFFNHDGTPLSGWTQFSSTGYNSARYYGSSEPSLALYDMDSDGKMEVIIGTNTYSSGRVYVFHADGTELAGWEGGKATTDVVVHTPAVGDLDNDGSPEIVVRDIGNKLYVWNTGGQLLWSDQLFGEHRPEHKIALADFDGDGDLEIVTVALSGPYSNKDPYLIIRSHDNVSILQKKIDYMYWARSFSIGDVDNDGLPEVIVPGLEWYYPAPDYSFPIACVEVDGSSCSGNWPAYADDDVYPGYPLIGDIDDDGSKEILFASWANFINEIVGFNADGSKITGPNWPIRKRGYGESSMALDDLDHDGDIELIHRGSYNKLRVWDLPYAYNPETMDWTMFQHDPQHTGHFVFKHDGDSDGYIDSEDCDDTDSEIHPGAVEYCDGIDNDCDGLVDSADSQGCIETFVITTDTLPDATSGMYYDQYVYITGGVTPYSCSMASGSLPTGIIMYTTSNKCRIVGTPAASGDFNFTLQVTDDDSNIATKDLTITVAVEPIVITTQTLPEATSGWYYNQYAYVTGGVMPYSCSIASGSLPAGIYLYTSSNRCRIVGTPAASGDFNFTLQITDNESNIGTKDMTLTVAVEPLEVTTETLPDATSGWYYNQYAYVTGGVTPYSCSIASGSLPTGIYLYTSSNRCRIVGTPAASGDFNFTLQITDADSNIGTKDLTITVAVEPIVVTTQTLPDATSGLYYNQYVNVTGGVTPYSCSIASGSLPTGISMYTTSNRCRIVGTPAASGDFNFTLQITDADSNIGTKDMTLTVAVNPIIVTTHTLPDATSGLYYNQYVNVTGGVTPYSCSIASGSLPIGISMYTTSNRCRIVGTPAASGDFNFTLQITDADSNIGTKDMTLTVAVNPIIVTTQTLQDATASFYYSQYVNVTGGVTPYSCSISAGSLPPGMYMYTSSNRCRIYGTPTATGDFNFTLQITDAESNIGTEDMTLTVTADPLAITTDTLPDGAVGQAYSTYVYGSGGVQPYTWSIVSGSLPPGQYLISYSYRARILGGPTDTGAYTFTLQAVDAESNVITKQFTINVN